MAYDGHYLDEAGNYHRCAKVDLKIGLSFFASLVILLNCFAPLFDLS